MAASVWSSTIFVFTITLTLHVSLPQNATVPSTAVPPTPQTINRTERNANVPPLIIIGPPEEVHFREEDRIQLPCEASGVPRPNYRWYINDEYFDPSGSDGRIAIQPGVGTLIFTRVLATDEAYYQCLAYNAFGQAFSVKTNLIRAILDPFPLYNPRNNSPHIGDPLTLRCTPPHSIPKANIFWILLLANVNFRRIDYSDRVTQDHIGNLHFVNIAGEDGKLGATYACAAENKVLRSLQTGEFYKIIPRGVQTLLHPSRILWQSPTQQVALRGQHWSIKCIFSGSPTPRVTWLRHGESNLPLDSRLESFGQQLTIDSVQYHHNGSYECQGINELHMTYTRRSFTLSVESAPYWVTKPESVEVAENESPEFVCVAEGRPEPTYFWYINGVPITQLPTDPRRIAGRNRLIFHNVTMEDAQVVQCNVTNKHGYNYTNAYLNVYRKDIASDAPTTAMTAPGDMMSTAMSTATRLVATGVASAALIAILSHSLIWEILLIEVERQSAC